MVFRYDELLLAETQHLPECPDHSGIGCHAAGEEHRLIHFFPSGYGAAEISRKGETQPCNYIMERCVNLLVMDHVTLCEDTAPSCNTGRGDRFQGQFSELLFNAYPDPPCLLVKK